MIAVILSIVAAAEMPFCTIPDSVGIASQGAAPHPSAKA
jgi:hypothetical protein